MLKTLKMMFALRKAYRSNSILYVLRQLPLINKILPTALSQSKVLNVIVTIIFAIWEISAIFIGKIIYYFGAIGYLRTMSDKLSNEVLFCQSLLFLTAIGLFLNVNFLDYRKDKGYAINIFKLNAKEYTLIDFGFSLVKIIVGTLPVAIYMGIAWGLPLWFLIAVPFCVACGKFIYASYVLATYERTGVVTYAGKSLLSWFGAIALGFAAFLMPVLEYGLPKEICMAALLLLIPAGLVCSVKVFTYKNYLKINKSMLSQMDIVMKKARKRQDNQVADSISADAIETSNKKGFEFFNELFVKRHKKLLWKPAVNLTIVMLAMTVIANALFIFLGGREISARVIDNMIPYFSFVVFTLNRGGAYTKALYLNCDHSMLTFSFYKKRNNVLKLFIIRLREIVKVNLLPALAMGLLLASMLYIPGDSESLKKCLLVLFVILAESVLFSVHYLVLYYLLQPYNVNTEVRSAPYMIAFGASYILIYFLMFQRIPLETFGFACLGFCAVYTVIASLLVYRFAPRTFKLKN